MQNQNYYYFVATLIPINYGDIPAISSDEFRELCQRFLSKEDLALIHYCKYDPMLASQENLSTGSKFLDYLYLRERNLLLNLATLRAAKLSRQSPVDTPPEDIPRTVSVGKAAFAIQDPLEAELYLDKERWMFLDEMLDPTDYFGVNTIYTYLLKLHLLERKQALDAIKGRKEYQNLYDMILSDYNNQ
jgi:hypothetical protein